MKMPKEQFSNDDKEMHTLVFAFSLERLKSRPSDLECKCAAVAVPKACFRSIEEQMSKRVGARTQPCFKPLLMSKGSDMLYSYWMVVFMSS